MDVNDGVVPGKGLNQTNTDHAEFSALYAASPELGLFKIGKQALNIGQEIFASGGETGSALGAFKKSYVQFRLEIADLAGKSGLSDVQVGSRLGKTAELGAGDKIAQMANFHDMPPGHRYSAILAFDGIAFNS